MNVAQSIWSAGAGWSPVRDGGVTRPDLVLAFGAPACWEDGDVMAALRARHGGAVVLGCSTAGEISGSHVHDDTLVATALQLDGSRLRTACADLRGAARSAEVGAELAAKLSAPDLVHVFVLSEGLEVNGSALVSGLARGLPPGVSLTGGLSGDGPRFRRTLVCLGERVSSGLVAAVGFYGRNLRVGYGSLGGWDPFGPDRIITRAEGNVLYELDGRSALALYRKYLGAHAGALPASGLHFPLLVRTSEEDPGVVRTILGIDEERQSMTFAGDMPQGALARLMKANFDRLIDGATGAASVTRQALKTHPAELAILISCVGRKLVLGQRTEEEVEAVRDILGEQPAMAGFYSYGEISPLSPGAKCDLHNQTMTITTLSETRDTR